MTIQTRVPGLLLLALAVALPAAAQENPHAVQDTAYTPGEYRVFTGAGEPATLDDVVAAMGAHDVVFVGETHDDPTGHMLEAELLARAWQTYGPPSGEDARPVALSLEFFEADVQLVLDEYLAGLVDEDSFLKASRPWPRYETDYRPLVELAKEHGVDVVAANAPRRYTSRVTREGRESLDALSPEAKAQLPPLPFGEPSPEYRNQWIEVISRVMELEGTKCGVPVENAPAPPGSHANFGNQMQSQVLWDASMGYRVAEYLEAHPDALVLHMVGGFHVARGTGTPEHLEAYAPESSHMIVMLRPVEDVGVFDPAPEGEWGDFVIQTDESRTLEAIECRAFRETHGG